MTGFTAKSHIWIIPVREIVLTTLLIFLAVSGLDAQDSGETTLAARFRQANQAYSEGDYARALAGYRELLVISGPSAELYYNAGCAALKAGELGSGVINFHRAARLSPRDEDIQANLKFVTELTSSEDQEEFSANVIFQLLSSLIFSLSTREAGALQLVFLLVFSCGAVLLAAGLSGALRKTALVVTAAGVLLLMGNSSILGAHIYRYSHVTEAVVVSGEAEALSGPGEDNTRVLVIPEGTVLRIRESRGDWALVSLPSGRSGWMKLSLVEVI
ncbi:hypothetical protein ACFL4X_00775 [Gemmatimonadota bacterium]